jgi:hypothetical protein
LFVFNYFALGIEIGEGTLAIGSGAAQAGACVGGVAQAGQFGLTGWVFIQLVSRQFGQRWQVFLAGFGARRWWA